MKLFGQFLGGVVGGLIGAAIWAAIVHFSGYEVGFVAWLVGILVGVGVGAAASGAGVPGSGLLAGVLALGAIGAGKVSVVWIGMQEYRAEAMGDEAMIAGLASESLDARVEAGEDFSEWYEWEYDGEDDSIAANYPPEVWDESEREWFAMTEAEREELRAEVSAEYDAATPFALIIGTLVSLGIFDFIWVALAVSSAYKIASDSGQSGPVEIRFDAGHAPAVHAQPPAAGRGSAHTESAAHAAHTSAPAPAPPRAPAAMGMGQTTHPLLKMGMQQSAAPPTNKPMRRLSDPAPTPEQTPGEAGQSEAA